MHTLDSLKVQPDVKLKSQKVLKLSGLCYRMPHFSDSLLKFCTASRIVCSMKTKLRAKGMG